MRNNKILITGPCSVETKEQFFNTAYELLTKCNPDYIRGGVWKPRTRPGNFEGNGEISLKWMSEFKEKYNIKTAVEVATKEQAKLAVEYNVDLLWIGARTTGNPFSIQELANFLSGMDVTVFIKNPMNADISLWIGAIERFEKAGIKKLGLIHRGFTVNGSSEYRNPPMWHIANEMKNNFINYPMICDPSHIAGSTGLIYNLCQNALNLNYDGLMIESHIDPENAWSDASQQLTPNDLKSLIEELDFKIYDSIEGVVNIHNHNSKSLIELLENEILYLLFKREELRKEVSESNMSFRNENLIDDKISELKSKIHVNIDFVNNLRVLFKCL